MQGAGDGGTVPAGTGGVKGAYGQDISPTSKRAARRPQEHEKRVRDLAAGKGCGSEIATARAAGEPLPYPEYRVVGVICVDRDKRYAICEKIDRWIMQPICGALAVVAIASIAGAVLIAYSSKPDAAFHLFSADTGKLVQKWCIITAIASGALFGGFSNWRGDFDKRYREEREERRQREGSLARDPMNPESTTPRTAWTNMTDHNYEARRIAEDRWDDMMDR